LNEPPEAGPTTAAAVKMKRPMRNGAMTPFHAARSSVATVRITITNSAVVMISRTSAAQLSIPLPGTVSSASVTSLV
jgi:hypothetical protein